MASSRISRLPAAVELTFSGLAVVGTSEASPPKLGRRHIRHNVCFRTTASAGVRFDNHLPRGHL